MYTPACSMGTCGGALEGTSNKKQSPFPSIGRTEEADGSGMLNCGCLPSPPEDEEVVEDDDGDEEEEEVEEEVDKEEE